MRAHDAVTDLPFSVSIILTSSAYHHITVLSPSLPERNLRTIKRTASNRNLLRPRLIVPTLQRSEPLHHPDRNIIRFSQRILLPQTDPGPSAERQVAPARAQRRISPAFWTEDFDVRAEDGGLPHHGVGVVDDAAVFGNEEGLQAVFAAAVREDGVFQGEAAEDRDGWVETEG